MSKVTVQAIAARHDGRMNRKGHQHVPQRLAKTRTLHDRRSVLENALRQRDDDDNHNKTTSTATVTTGSSTARMQRNNDLLPIQGGEMLPLYCAAESATRASMTRPTFSITPARTTTSPAAASSPSASDQRQRHDEKDWFGRAGALVRKNIGKQHRLESQGAAGLIARKPTSSKSMEREEEKRKEEEERRGELVLCPLAFCQGGVEPANQEAVSLAWPSADHWRGGFWDGGRVMGGGRTSRMVGGG